MFLGFQLQLWTLSPGAEAQLSRYMKGANPCGKTHRSLNSLSHSLSLLGAKQFNSLTDGLVTVIGFRL